MPADTCCGKGGSECICAKNATCSCGKRSAMQCNCERSAAENADSGARCSCGLRPAGACTCETTTSTSPFATETDFTTRK